MKTAVIPKLDGSADTYGHPKPLVEFTQTPITLVLKPVLQQERPLRTLTCNLRWTDAICAGRMGFDLSLDLILVYDTQDRIPPAISNWNRQVFVFLASRVLMC